MVSVWKGKKPLPMGGYVTEEIIGGKVRKKGKKGKKRASKKMRGVGIIAENPSTFTKALNKRAKKKK